MASRIKQRVSGSVRGAQNKKIVGQRRTIGGRYEGEIKQPSFLPARQKAEIQEEHGDAVVEKGGWRRETIQIKCR